MFDLLDYDVNDAEPIVPIDEGDYPVRVQTVEVKPSKSSARSNLQIGLVILDGKFKGRNITRFITLPIAEDKKTKYEDGRTAWGAMTDRLFKTFEGLGAPVKEGKKPDTALLIGQQGIARIRKQEITDADGEGTGEYRDNVVSIFQPKK